MVTKQAGTLKISGQTTLETQPLEISFASEMVYVPSQAGQKGGLFHIDGSPIPSAVNHRGNEVVLSSGIDKAIDINSLPIIDHEGGAFFIGAINPHYGHFLLESTTRLWPLLHMRNGFPGNYLFLGSPAVLANKAFIRQVFEAQGLNCKNFTAYRTPCRIKNVFVPAPAFEIRLRIHALFRESMQHIGRCLVDDIEKINNTNLTPLYLSKARLKVGVSGIDNEKAIEVAMQKAGIDILHPETLSLTEQIRTLASRKYLLGSVGSALHTLLFCPGGKTISGVSLGEKINSNYIMIDRLYGNIGHYGLSADMKIVMVGKKSTDATDGFMRIFHARNPDYATKELLAALDNGLPTYPNLAK